MNILFKLLICLLTAVLWRIGGWHYRWVRVVLVPILLGIVLGFITKSWLVGFLSIGSYQIIRIGYGNYDPETDPKSCWLAKITKDRSGDIIRMIAGSLYGIIGALFIILFKHLSIPFYIFYILLNAGMGYFVSWFTFPIWDDIFDEGLSGLAVSSIIFLVG